MANTFTQLHIHIVFSVRRRASMIRDAWRENLHRYITGIVQNKGHKMLAINSMSDHIHFLIGLRPDVALSDIVRDIKANSSKMDQRREVPADPFRVAGRIRSLFMLARRHSRRGHLHRTPMGTSLKEDFSG